MKKNRLSCQALAFFFGDRPTRRWAPFVSDSGRGAQKSRRGDGQECDQATRVSGC